MYLYQLKQYFMKIITEEEVAQLQVNTFDYNPVSQMARELAVGQSMTFTLDEWKPKGHPGINLGTTFKRLGRKIRVRKLSNGAGWLVTRLI